MNPNHYLAAAIAYLFAHRPQWRQRQRGRQDHRLQRDHRPRRGQARPQAGRDPGRVQMVRRRPDRRRVRLCRRGKRRRLVPAAGRIGVDHRQGRPHPGTAGGRDDGADPKRSEPVVRPIDRRARRALLRADRRAGDAGAEEPAEGAFAGQACASSNSPASRSARRSPPRPATASRSAASRLSPTAAGSRRGLPAPRTSTRSMPRAFKSESHLRQIQSEAQAAIDAAFKS